MKCFLSTTTAKKEEEEEEEDNNHKWITLPDLSTLDAEQLRALILAQQVQLAQRDIEIEHLKLFIAKLKRMRFGRAPSSPRTAGGWIMALIRPPPAGARAARS